MKPGDLVELDAESYLAGQWIDWGYGFIISVSPGIGYTICILFPELISSSFDGLKWCQKDSIRIVSES